MAGVRIRVESGPDEGLEVALCRAQVRIGRGPAANVQLTDQGFLGTLAVKFDGGVYHAANQVTDTVGRPIALRLLPPEGTEEWQFPPSNEAVWVAGHKIRLTADTLLVLTTDFDLDLPDGKHEVSRSRPTAKAKKERDLVYIVLIVVLFGLAAYLFSFDPEQGAAQKSETDVSKQYADVTGRLKQLVEDETLAAKQWPKEPQHATTARHARAISVILQDARLAEVSGRRTEAADKYVQARDELNRVLGSSDGTPGSLTLPEETAASFQAARKFVAERVIELKDFIASNRSGR